MRALALCLAFSFCLMLTACAGQPVESGKARSITVAEEQPPQIVFAPDLHNTGVEGAVYALLATHRGNDMPQPATIGAYSLQKSYMAAAGTPCAVITAPAADLLACRDAAHIWHVQKTLLDKEIIFGTHR